ncbi:hypothetical protein VB776_04490 [Arcicella sp. DC2W]|uniref:Uncharacterized protein n=1 Tax=Arcicella gelida TaxID=2984195 RepID=A0ABU5S131_9BACT|nr:hypothetical protein [Arcicella sp. DC2W]MEA5402156.1 hypothetical protein [Arcicella sp. DC2W]
MKKNPITFFAEREVKDKLDEKLKATGMTKEEYLSWLIESDSIEDEEEIVEEETTESNSLAGIVNVTEKDDLIASLQDYNRGLEQRISEFEEDILLDKLFPIVRGHSLNIKGSKSVYEIETKADFFKCLVHNFYIGFDPEDFGLDENWDDDDEEEDEYEEAYDDDDDDDDDDEPSQTLENGKY